MEKRGNCQLVARDKGLDLNQIGMPCLASIQRGWSRLDGAIATRHHAAIETHSEEITWRIGC